MDCFRNIAVVPASLAFDRFMSRLDEVGEFGMGDDGRFRFKKASRADFRRVYMASLKGILDECIDTARHVVFVDECLPQNCVTSSCARTPPRFMEPHNVVRWTVDEALDVPVDVMNYITLTWTKTVLGKDRRVIYLASRALPERLLLDGVRSVIGPRIANRNPKRLSSQWRRVNRYNGEWTNVYIPHVANGMLKESLEYLTSKLLK